MYFLIFFWLLGVNNAAVTQGKKPGEVIYETDKDLPFKAKAARNPDASMRELIEELPTYDVKTTSVYRYNNESYPYKNENFVNIRNLDYRFPFTVSLSGYSKPLFVRPTSDSPGINASNPFHVKLTKSTEKMEVVFPSNSDKNPFHVKLDKSDRADVFFPGNSDKNPFQVKISSLPNLKIAQSQPFIIKNPNDQSFRIWIENPRFNFTNNITFPGELTTEVIKIFNSINDNIDKIGELIRLDSIGIVNISLDIIDALHNYRAEQIAFQHDLLHTLGQLNSTMSTVGGMNYTDWYKIYYGQRNRTNSTKYYDRDSPYSSIFDGILGGLENILISVVEGAIRIIFDFLKTVIVEFIEFVLKGLFALLPVLEELVKLIIYILRRIVDFILLLFKELNKDYFLAEIVAVWVVIYIKHQNWIYSSVIVILFAVLFDLRRNIPEFGSTG